MNFVDICLNSDKITIYFEDDCWFTGLLIIDVALSFKPFWM